MKVRNLISICASAILLTLIMLPHAYAGELRIGTMDLPPYGWIDGQGNRQGMVYDLHQELGRRSGSTFSNEILPFSRQLRMLKCGKLDLLSSQPHANALEAGDKLAVQFHINVIIVPQKGSDLKELKDFTGTNILYHFSASYPQLDTLPRKIHRIPEYKAMISMLKKRQEIQGAVFSEPAYYYWLHKLDMTADDFGEPIYVQKNRPQYIFVRNDMPERQRNRLKLIVDEMNKEQIFEKMVDEMKY